MTSPDGITWTVRTAAEANSWRAITWSSDLSLFVAVSSDGTNRVMTSPDGTTWTARSVPSQDWRSVTWSSDLSLFVAGGTSIMTSSNGTAWTERTESVNGTWYGVAANTTTFVAVTDMIAYTDVGSSLTSIIDFFTADNRCVVYVDRSGINAREVYVGELDTSTYVITFGTPTELEQNVRCIYNPDENRVVFVGEDASLLITATGIINSIANTIAISSVALQEDFGITFLIDEVLNIVSVDSNIYCIANETGSLSQRFKLYKLSVSGSSVSIVTSLIIPYSGLYAASMLIANGKLISFINSHIRVIIDYLVINLEDLPFEFIGFAEKDILSGESSIIKLFGVTTLSTTLVPCRYYYIDNSSLTTIPNLRKVGIAITNNKLLIINN